MAQQLTARQAEILRFIVDYLHEKSFPPTFREIGEAIGINSTKAVNDHLAVLARKGYIRREKGKSRAIHILQLPPGTAEPARTSPREARVITVERPIEIIEGAAIAANPIGTGTYADYATDQLPVDSSLFGGGQCFALRVSGDSMEGAHICDGDLAIIRKADQVRNGEIAAIDFDGEVTLKYFKKQASMVVLQSANPLYEPKLVDTNQVPVRILGRFVGIIRQHT